MTAETDIRWQAVARRDPAANGQFVYAVRTTGVYCRPSCASRQPRRENVTFFALPALAEAAGYRACKRCHPREARIADSRALLTQQVAAYLAAQSEDPAALSLEAIGGAVGYAPSHVSAVFKEVLGVTPRQYDAVDHDCDDGQQAQGFVDHDADAPARPGKQSSTADSRSYLNRSHGFKSRLRDALAKCRSIEIRISSVFNMA